MVNFRQLAKVRRRNEPQHLVTKEVYATLMAKRVTREITPNILGAYTPSEIEITFESEVSKEEYTSAVTKRLLGEIDADSFNHYVKPRKAAIEKAREAGLVVVFANNFTLQLDIDNFDTMKLVKKQMKILEKMVKYGDVVQTNSKSGDGHKHLYIHLRDQLDLSVRIAYQAMLGSDRTRELLNYKTMKRVVNSGGEFDSEDIEPFLFEKPDAKQFGWVP